MIESPALDFWRKSEKPEMESYTIDYDFRKIQVKNTASYWLLPYIYIDIGHKFWLCRMYIILRRTICILHSQ